MDKRKTKSEIFAEYNPLPRTATNLKNAINDAFEAGKLRKDTGASVNAVLRKSPNAATGRGAATSHSSQELSNDVFQEWLLEMISKAHDKNDFRFVAHQYRMKWKEKLKQKTIDDFCEKLLSDKAIVSMCEERQKMKGTLYPSTFYKRILKVAIKAAREEVGECGE